MDTRIELSRFGIRHILLVNIDDIPDFFQQCDIRQQSASPLVSVNKGIFVWCFCSRSQTQLSKILGNLTYFILLSRQMVEIDCTPHIKKDSACIALCMTLGELHERVPFDVPVTVLGCDALMSEANDRISDGRDFAIISAGRGRQSWVLLLQHRLSAQP